MMRINLHVILIVIIALGNPINSIETTKEPLTKTTTTTAINAKSDYKSKWTLIDALNFGSLFKGFNGSWISENEILYNSANGDHRIFNVDTSDDKLFISKSDIEGKWRDANLRLFPNKKQILVTHEQESLFRYSNAAKYDIYDFETQKVTRIADGQLLQFCTFSPSGERLVYVLNNNVYIRQSDGKEYKLTSDGKVGVIYNGIPDWVYEEEVFKTASTIWWSKDSEKLAMAHFNDVDVKTYKYFIYGDDANDPINQYPEELELRYPKAGTTNPLVQLKIANIKNVAEDMKVNWIELTAPEDIVSKDHILDKVNWADNEHVLVFWLNRRQNKGVFMLCNLSGKCDKVLNMEEPNGWLMPSQLNCFIDGQYCLMINWIGNWQQVWKLNLKTGKNEWKSLGNFTVLNIYGLNEKTNELFYQGTLESDPIQQHVFKNKECLSCHLQDMSGTNCTNARALFSKNFKYYAVTCSGPFPSYTKIINTSNDTEVYNWEDNKMLWIFLHTKLMPKTEFLDVPISGNFSSKVKLYLPPSFDWKNTTKKYPLIVDVYGGPNSVRISTAMRVGWSGYMATQHNVIYAEIETRGSGNKGKDILMTLNNQFGSYEVTDQIETVKKLHETYPNIFDRERTGIWGWSYGGFVTAMAIAKDTDRVFQGGISVAPVTSWSLYDSIYTERYMGLPTKDDNLLNYLKSDVTDKLENFKSHDYLLIHGVADDNVHVQHSMLLAKALQNADISYEEMYYPDETHSISHVQPHLYHTMEHFWINCLNLETDE